ncbi:MAG: MoaD/ThiS family protein [Candidatus Bathyarchaeota archaeon]|nr:MoaD/ThiS family protein [Candidatus Bathyarchaeota archaeon]
MTISVQIEFVGTLQKLSNKKHITLEFENPAVVQDVIAKLLKSFTSEFREFLIDAELNDPRPNVLLVLNKTEIGALNGLETNVKSGDKLTLIPISHGG